MGMVELSVELCAVVTAAVTAAAAPVVFVSVLVTVVALGLPAVTDTASVLKNMPMTTTMKRRLDMAYLGM